MKKVISVRFKDNGKTYYFDPADTPIKTGDYVIVETARGVECGEVVQGVKEIADSAVPKALKPITRMADSVDVRRMRQNREDEKRARYYNYYTGRTWGEGQNYDIVVNTSHESLDKIADAIIAYIEAVRG